MGRTYTLRKRAEQQAQTRRRIVEAAVDLHGSVGPAQTTISMIADRAGVQRHTLYAHFPDERSLLMACSAHSLERDPLPDPSAWRDAGDGSERLRAALDAVYGWYERNAELAACVLRDAEYHAPTREIAALRWAPSMIAYQETLGAGLAPRQQAMLRLSLGFHTWRTLVRDSGLDRESAVAAMVEAIEGADGGR